jgi:asparagine synthase (glutamine-hydrolysing)
MMAADVGTLLPDDFLVKVDRASMAHGLEVRPPLLDHELLELAARIPAHWKVRQGQTKWVLKEAYRERLTPEVVDRPKHGFDMPIDAWLRGPLRERFESAVLEPGARVRDLVDQQTAGALYRAHVSGAGRHGGVLWSLLVLARWAERYLAPSFAPQMSR